MRTQKNEEFLCHTWYARSYGINDKHSKRINSILNNIDNNIKNQINDFILWKDSYFFINKFYYKIKRKIKTKLNIK